jgi:hypothetical protein
VQQVDGRNEFLAKFPNNSERVEVEKLFVFTLSTSKVDVHLKSSRESPLASGIDTTISAAIALSDHKNPARNCFAIEHSHEVDWIR